MKSLLFVIIGFLLNNYLYSQSIMIRDSLAAITNINEKLPKQDSTQSIQSIYQRNKAKLTHFNPDNKDTSFPSESSKIPHSHPSPRQQG